MANHLVNELEEAGEAPLRASSAEKAAYEAGLKTAYALNRMSSKVSLDYMTMAIVQDALRAYREAITTKTT